MLTITIGLSDHSRAWLGVQFLLHLPLQLLQQSQGASSPLRGLGPALLLLLVMLIVMLLLAVQNR